MKLFGRTLLVAFILAVAAVPAGAAESKHVAKSAAFIRELAERAVGTLTAEDITVNERRERFRSLFQEGFAVRGIARFALGRYWRRASAAERSEYLMLFEEVIVRTWADRFTDYSGQKFDVNGAIDAKSPRRTENAALVRSVFFTDPKTPVKINWRVANQGELYKITDVLVEGVSMANTQRDEFAAVIRKNGGQVANLITVLRERRDARPAD